MPDSVWVVWDTLDPSVGIVAYGPTSELGNSAQEKQAALHHEVHLTGLQPYSAYFYQVNGGEVSSFRTAADIDQTTFRFAVIGDTQDSGSVHRALIKQMVKAAPDFVLHTGDLVESGRFRSEWDRFFETENALLRTAPLYPTLGNHEDYDLRLYDSQYRDVFHLPGNELWYAFDYGNARFICLKVDGYPVGAYYPGEEQLTWLEEQLAANEAPWLFVFFHIGIFTSRSEDDFEISLREMLVPLFEQYDVDAVFMGHHHSYERILENGITYIITGGGGGSLYPLESPEPGSQVVHSAHHFMVFDMKDDQLVGLAIDRNGQVLDAFTLQAEK